MYEVWVGDGQDEHLVLETESFKSAYEVAGLWGVVVWVVDRTRNVCEPLPHLG